MKGFYTVKLAVFCVVLAGLLHVPGLIYAQKKAPVEKIQVFDFPVISQPYAAIKDPGDIRESPGDPEMGIMPLAPYQSPTKIFVSYLPYNIRDNAFVNIYLDVGDGVQQIHESIILNESANHQIQSTQLNFPDVGEVYTVTIEGCQDPFNCTSVVIIVTIDGTRSGFGHGPN